MDPFETLTATQSPVDPFGTPPATPRPAADVADFVNAMESRWCARSAPLERRRRDRRRARQRRRSMLAGRWWSRRGARGARHWSAEGATGGARVSAGGARWHTVESQRSADNFTVQRSAPTGHLVTTFVITKISTQSKYVYCTRVHVYMTAGKKVNK